MNRLDWKKIEEGWKKPHAHAKNLPIVLKLVLVLQVLVSILLLLAVVPVLD